MMVGINLILGFGIEAFFTTATSTIDTITTTTLLIHSGIVIGINLEAFGTLHAITEDVTLFIITVVVATKRLPSNA